MLQLTAISDSSDYTLLTDIILLFKSKVNSSKLSKITLNDLGDNIYVLAFTLFRASELVSYNGQRSYQLELTPIAKAIIFTYLIVCQGKQQKGLLGPLLLLARRNCPSQDRLL